MPAGQFMRRRRNSLGLSQNLCFETAPLYGLVSYFAIRRFLRSVRSHAARASAPMPPNT